MTIPHQGQPSGQPSKRWEMVHLSRQTLHLYPLPLEDRLQKDPWHPVKKKLYNNSTMTNCNLMVLSLQRSEVHYGAGQQETLFTNHEYKRRGHCPFRAKDSLSRMTSKMISRMTSKMTSKMTRKMTNKMTRKMTNKMTRKITSKVMSKMADAYKMSLLIRSRNIRSNVSAYHKSRTVENIRSRKLRTKTPDKITASLTGLCIII